MSKQTVKFAKLRLAGFDAKRVYSYEATSTFPLLVTKRAGAYRVKGNG